MKKLTFLIVFVSLYSVLSAENDPKSVKAKVKDVTVFFSGAQLTHSGEAYIAAGTSTLIVEDLSMSLNPQSIQVKGEGNFAILSVVHQINYLKSQEKSPEAIRIEDSLKILQNLISYQQSMLNVFIQEEAMLLANKVIGGEQNGTPVAALKEAMEYFRLRMTDIKDNQLKIQSKITAYQARQSVLNNQLSAINGKVSQPTSEILITVNAAAAVNARLSVSYFVSSAGWKPTYDLRATDINSSIELDFRANVYQTTGTDWTQVNLTLSTGNPTQNGSRPVLNPWYLNIVQPYRYSAVTGNVPQAKTESVEETKADGDYKGGYAPVSVADYVTVDENQTNIEYEIGIPYSIPSDGKEYMVEVQKKQLIASYQYYCVPKLDNDVYLLARVSGWEQYNIISGNVNLFFEGTYVGKSYIDTRTTGDTLEFSLGSDKNIVVERQKLLEYSEAKFIGLNKKETFTYEISIRNKKKQNIDLLIEDQLPLTTNKDIEVEKLEISGAMHDEVSGKLSWKMILKPAENKKLRLSYSVKYPKDKIVNTD